MGFSAGSVSVMSMDDFGFFSEATDPAAAAASSYSNSPRTLPTAHPSSSRHDYHKHAEQYQTRPAPPSQQHYSNYQNQSHDQHQAVQQQPASRLASQNASGDAAVPACSQNTMAAGPGSAAPAKRGSNLACLKCRAIKVKCWKSNPNDPRCARCNRLDLFCEFREHHRGKKLEKVIADENRNLVLSPEMLRRARLNMLRCSSYPLNVDLATVAVPQSTEDASFLAFQSNMLSHSHPGAFSGQAYSVTGFASTSLPSPVAMASSVYDDVVRMNTCSWTDACYLFSLFLTQLNPIVALLEPGLHTVQYTQEQSPILFSTILSIASRFFRPDLHLQCQSAAASVLKLASIRQLCSIDHIQALIVSAIWAAPGDSSRTDSLVAATAYAYELGLPFCFEVGVAVSSATKPYTPPIPIQLLHGGHQTTILRMQQRTWIQLCLLDLSQQSDARRTPAQKRPELVAQNDLPNVRAWYELNNSTMSAYDTRLAYQLDFAMSQRSFNRLAASVQMNASSISEGELSRWIDALRLQERECFSAWFNMHGDEYVARYGMDCYSNAEAGYLLVLYRFARAVQLHSIVAESSSRQLSHHGTGITAPSTLSQLEDRWLVTATELAFKVLEAFMSKVLEHEATSSSMLRFSPPYMASGCLSVARWFLDAESQPQEHQRGQGRLDASTVEHARERVSEVIRLLAQPQFYPDGNRVPTTNENTGQLDQALRSLTGDGGIPIASGAATSPKRARAYDKVGMYAYQGVQQSKGGAGSAGTGASDDWGDGQNRKQRRRTSNGSLVRVELGSVGGQSVGAMSESAGSERGGSEWSPHLSGEKWNGGRSSGYVSGSDDTASLSIEASLGEPHWPPSLLGMPSTSASTAAAGGSWTRTSEGALSTITMASSISPPASTSSAVFSVPASALPEQLDIGLASVASVGGVEGVGGMGGVGGGAYGYTNARTSSMSACSLPMSATTASMLSSHPEHSHGHARSYDRHYQPSHLVANPYSSQSDATTATLQRMFASDTVLPSGQVVGLASSHRGQYQDSASLPHSFSLARDATATQPSYGNGSTRQSRYSSMTSTGAHLVPSGGASSSAMSQPFAPSSLADLDASLTVGLSSSYDGSSSGFLGSQQRN